MIGVVSAELTKDTISINNWRNYIHVTLWNFVGMKQKNIQNLEKRKIIDAQLEILSIFGKL